MADFKTADICGASPNLNSVLEKMDSLKTSLSSSLTVSPSALSSTLSTEVSALSSSLSSMIPELPSAPDVSLQAELTGLSNIDLTLPSGLLEYRSKLDSITSQFGESLTSAGFSLDDLVSQVAPSIPSLPGAPSVDLCSVVPNFKLPDGATEAVESAAETLMADAPGVAEKLSEVTANSEVASVQADLKKVTDAISNGTAYTKASKTIEIKTQDVEQAPIKVVRVKDNLTTKTEDVGGQTVTVKERPRTVDTSVAKYFDKPVEIEKIRIISIDALPAGRWKTQLLNAWKIRHTDSPDFQEAFRGSAMQAPLEGKDGSIFPYVTEEGMNVLKNFTDSNISIFRPVRILKVRGILKDKLRKGNENIAGFPPNKKDAEKSGAFVFFDVNKIFKRGTKDFDNYLVIPNKEQFAYIDVKYEQGTVYNANFKDETREALTT